MPESIRREGSISTPSIQYRYMRFQLSGPVHHSADALYGFEPRQGIRLATVKYNDGRLERVVLKYGAKEDLLREHLERLARRRRSFAFGGHGPSLYPTHDAVSFVPQGSEFLVYDDEEPRLGQVVNVLREGEPLHSEVIPYSFGLNRSIGRITFRRIDLKDRSVWEFDVPNEAPVEGPEEIPINFSG